MHATVGGQSHQVELFALLLGVAISGLHLRVLHDRAVLAGAVDFHKVLINNASGTYIEVSHFRVAHLSVGKTHVFAAGLQLSVCTNCC